MHSASQLVHVVQKKTGFTNLRSYFIKNSRIRSSVVCSELTTSTFTQEYQGTLYTFSTCRDPVKISVGVVITLRRHTFSTQPNECNVQWNCCA